jgi:hypothetical protein
MSLEPAAGRFAGFRAAASVSSLDRPRGTRSEPFKHHVSRSFLRRSIGIDAVHRNQFALQAPHF